MTTFYSFSTDGTGTVVWSRPYDWSLSQSSYTNPDNETPTAGDDVVLGGNVIIGGSANDLTGGFDLYGAISDVNGMVPSTDDAGIENGGVWTNTGSLDDEGFINVGGQLDDDGSDTIGLTTTSALLYVTGAAAAYSDTGSVTDDGIINTYDGGSITLGSLTGTGYVDIGADDAGGSTAQIGSVSISGLSVGELSSLTAGAITVDSFQVLGTATVGSLDFADLSQSQYLTVGSSGNLTDSGGLIGNGNGFITDDGTFTLGGGNLVLGGVAGSSVDFSLNGTLDFVGNVAIGIAGIGELEVSTSYTINNSLTLGSESTGFGGINVTGSSGDLTVAGSVTVGAAGGGEVQATLGGTLTVQSLTVDAGATVPHDYNDIVASGASSLIDVIGDATIGAVGAANADIESGGTVEVGGSAVLGAALGASGFLIVSEGRWQSGGILDVGLLGTGDVKVIDDGYGSAALAAAAVDVNNGSVEVYATGATLNAAGDLNVGAAANAMQAILSISAGASATASAMAVAVQSTSGTYGGLNNVTVDGAGSTLKISNSVTLDGALPTATNRDGDPDGTDGIWNYTSSGIGQIAVEDGAYMSIGQALTLQSPAPFSDLTIGTGGGVEVGGNNGLTADTLQIDAQGLIVGHAQITGTRTGKVQVAATTTAPTWSLDIVNNGTIKASNGTLVLDGNLSGNGQVLIGQNATLEIGGTVADDTTIMFLPGGGQEIIIDDPIDFHGTISSENFEPSDAIDLPNVPYIDPGSADLNPDGASFYFETGEDEQNYVLQVVEGNQTYNIPINEDAPLTGGFTLAPDGHAGTLITYSTDPVTGYSVTAAVDGPETKSYSGVVRITSGVEGAGTYATGSGFAVGPNLILTAMHVVFRYLQPDGYVHIQLADGDKVSGFLGPHGQNSNKGGQTDWAYVYVPNPLADFQPSQTFVFDSTFDKGIVRATGYPKAVRNGPPVNTIATLPQQYTWNQIGEATYSGISLAPGLVGGFSGGPTWIKIGSQAYVVGINDTIHRSINVRGIPIDPELAADLRFLYVDAPSDAARVTSATVVQVGDAESGQTVEIVVDLSENVAITGTGPTLTLNDGGAATYNAANSTGTELEFDYIVGAGDQTSNLEVIQVNDTQTVQAAGGASIDFTVLDALPTDVSINSPLVVAFTAVSQAGEADAGASVQLTLTMSAPVIVILAGGPPVLQLDDDAIATYDAAASDPSMGKLVFEYVVGSGDETANLSVMSVVLPADTTVQDAAGYNADFSAAINSPTGLQVGPAYITSISTSLSSDLTVGQTVQLTLAMSQGVTVDTTGGSPTLTLSDGASATYDAAASDPSAGDLVFDYAVGSVDHTTDLQILGYNPGGATVTDAHGVSADLSGATQYDLTLDVNAATVTSVMVSPATGEADSGQAVLLTLTMSEPVTVDLTGGLPTLSLDDGATATYNSAASDTAAGTLVFDYTVGATDETPSLQISQVNLNGATIDDANGNAANLSAAANLTTTLQIGPAFVTSVTPALTGEIFTGQTDQITLAMSQGVTVATTGGSPTLSLSDGVAATYDSGASDPSTGTLVFDYTPGASDYTTDLTVLGYNPNGATVTDATGVAVDFSGVSQSDLQLDVNAAIVTAVTSSPSSGEADSGAQITVTLTMNEAVIVNTTNGAPTLSLSDGATATYNSAASDPAAGTLAFDYTANASDETPDLQIIQVNLHGATIDDANGNAAALSAASSFDTGLQIGPVFVDSVTPSQSGDIATGQTVQLTVSMSAGVTVDSTNGSPTLSLSDRATATYDIAASAPSDGTLVFDYKVAAGDYASGLSVAGLNDDGATITDADGIGPDFSGLAQSFLGLDVNAATVTNVTASPVSGEALSGQQVLLTLTMSVPVTVNLTGGLPTLYLSDGAVATYDSAASDPAADALVFAYTVGATDQDPDLQIARVNLNGATIDDANGNTADLSAAPTIATNLQVGAADQTLPCFLIGTRIATPNGDIPVEALSVGDTVHAHFAGRAAIRWIGHRRLDCRRHPEPRKVWPVRIRAGAFRPALPQRDLWLSPDHAVFAEDVLIPVKYLINGSGITQVETDEVMYYHVELDLHDVLLAEGLTVESYLPTGNRAAFDNGDGPVQLHPEFVSLAWDGLACAPLVVAGDALAGVQRGLSAQRRCRRNGSRRPRSSMG